MVLWHCRCLQQNYYQNSLNYWETRHKLLINIKSQKMPQISLYNSQLIESLSERTIENISFFLAIVLNSSPKSSPINFIR